MKNELIGATLPYNNNNLNYTVGMELINKTDKQKKNVLAALEKTLGIVTSACKKTGTSRSQFYKWMNDDEEFRAAVDDVNEQALDFAESKLLEQISNGEISSTIFYLKTKGKKRGYVEKTETRHDFGDEITGFEINIRRNHEA